MSLTLQKLEQLRAEFDSMKRHLKQMKGLGTHHYSDVPPFDYTQAYIGPFVADVFNPFDLIGTGNLYGTTSSIDITDGDVVAQVALDYHRERKAPVNLYKEIKSEKSNYEEKYPELYRGKKDKLDQNVVDRHRELGYMADHLGNHMDERYNKNKMDYYEKAISNMDSSDDRVREALVELSIPAE